MAGRRRFNEAKDWLLREAARQDFEPLEFIEEYIGNGGNLTKLAERITQETNTPVSRNVLHKVIVSLDPEAETRLEEARKLGAHSLVEKQQKALDDLGLDKDEISRENLRVRNTQWLAGVMNRRAFGAQPAANVHLSFGGIHLDVLRRLSAEDAKKLAHVPDSPALPSGDVVEADYTIESEQSPESLI